MSEPELIVVPSEIFFETVDLIQHRIGHEQAVAASTFLRSLPNVQVRPASAGILSSCWETHVDARGKLSLADALVVAWCKSENADPFTFDKEIARRAGGR